MPQLMMMILFMSLIPMIMFSINLILSKKMHMNQEKMSPFECGFNPITNARMPFSIQFFTISLIFLIFDIEIALLLPLIYLSLNFNPIITTCSFTFLMILIIGLYLEYNEYSMDWKI